MTRSRVTAGQGLGAGLLAAMLLCAVPAQAQQVRIKVDYTYVARGPTGGVGRTDWTVGATLLGGNKVVDTYAGQGQRGRTSGGGAEQLGAGRWRVAGPSELIRVTDWPNSQTIVHVYVSGQTCRATVEAHLKPGRTTYLVRSASDGRMIEMGEPSYDNIRCSIE